MFIVFSIPERVLVIINFAMISLGDVWDGDMALVHEVHLGNARKYVIGLYFWDKACWIFTFAPL